MRSKETKSDIITPKKSVQKIKLVQSSNRKEAQATCLKDLLPPIQQKYVDTLTNLTPFKRQPEFLLSPSPIKKDLFNQLLGSQIKNSSPYNTHILSYDSMIMEEEDNEYMEDESNKSDSEENSQMNDSENDCMWQDENGIKKRKRKSTVQIKMLKQELEGEMNWTKEKIVRMAEITGLSQSQVYKWCWDQKKKSMKYKDCQKRKIIRKQFGNKENQGQRRDQDEDFCNKLARPFEGSVDIKTKPKMSSVLQEADLNTEKKINKKLVFN